MLVPTLALLNVDVVVPPIVILATSSVITPLSIAVPVNVAAFVASYSLLFAVTPVIVKALAVMVAVNPVG